MKSNLSCLVGAVILWGTIVSCSSKAPNHDGNETTVVTADTLTADSIVAEEPMPVSEQDVQAKKEFLEIFYQELDQNDLDPSYIKKHITPKAQQILKDSYDYDCEDGDFLAVWLFAYEPGSDPGDFVSRRIKEVNENDYLVETQYELSKYTVLLTVIKDGDTYKIDDIKEQPEKI